MTTKVRFTITISTVTALLVGILATFVYVRVRTEMLSQATQSLETFLNHEADHLLHPMDANGLVIDKNHFGDFLLKISTENEVLFDGFSKKNTVIAPPSYIVKETTRNLNGRHLTLTGAYSLTPLYAYLDSLLQTLILGWALTLGFVIPISYYLSLALLRPFRRLATKTSELSVESLAFRFATSKYKDEEGLLISSFNALLARLERSFENMKRFASNVSHEIRTPVSVVMSQSEMALRKNRTSEEYRSALEKSLEESKRLKNIIDNLLSLAEIDRIHDENRKTTFLVYKKIEEIIDSLSIRWGKERNIVIDCDPGLAYTGNEVAFTSIVANLIENALKYGKKEVRVSCMEQGERIVFLIEDDGPGMTSLENKTNEPLSPTSGQTSHGLGLSIVRAFSEAYGGELSLTKSALGGLCAATSLPFK